MPIERVLLWGFMASGKTAVGAGLAARLGWSHVDLDDEIVRRAGKPIADIFREDGEAAFRELETRSTQDLLGRPHTVFSPGGGWVTNPGLQDTIPDGTLTIWLRVEPETVIARVTADAVGAVRPLLLTPDPGDRIRRLLAEREPAYGRAARAIPTDHRSVESIVAEIEDLVRHDPPTSGRREQTLDG